MLDKIVICAECGSKMVLRDSKYGKFYGCGNYPRCQATHCAHQKTGEPMGVPTTKEGKKWRIDAHNAFDTLWKSGKMKRNDAYKWLADAMGITRKECHIGLFDIEQCKRCIDVVKGVKQC